MDGEKDKNGIVLNYFPESRGIKTDRYTFCLTLNKKTGKLKSALLFDDKKDPYQQNNLKLSEHKKLVRKLCKQMVPLLKNADDPWFKNRILSDMIPY